MTQTQPDRHGHNLVVSQKHPGFYVQLENAAGVNTTTETRHARRFITWADALDWIDLNGGNDRWIAVKHFFNHPEDLNPKDGPK